MKLTDRKKSPNGALPTDLIHIVQTGDTSQNSAGSSYKAEMIDYDGIFLGTYVTGGTHNVTSGVSTFTNNKGATFQVPNYFKTGDDTFVTGGTYNATTGVVTFNNNKGGAFNVTGFFVPDNLQKTITANYTLVSADNNYTIFIDNGANPVTITVPAGLLAKIQVGFIQLGTGDVTFVASGTTILTPLVGAFKIKGQNYNAYLEQNGSSNILNLLGNLKV